MIKLMAVVLLINPITCGSILVHAPKGNFVCIPINKATAIGITNEIKLINLSFFFYPKKTKRKTSTNVL